MSSDFVQPCMRCIIRGKVQGVFFRVSTQQRARQLDITGYAKNLRDGCVEVVACGEPASLDQLKEWLWQGSSAASVTHVECESIPERHLSDFQTL